MMSAPCTCSGNRYLHSMKGNQKANALTFNEASLNGAPRLRKYANCPARLSVDLCTKSTMADSVNTIQGDRVANNREDRTPTTLGWIAAAGAMSSGLSAMALSRARMAVGTV